MDVWGLTVFKAVAEHGSISKAAKGLHCVQSNVTARIKQLEGELGAQLFYRKSRGMELTPKGVALLPYADSIKRLVKEAAHVVQDSDEARGPLLIGTMESTAAVRLPDLLMRYHRRNPKVELQLYTNPTERLIKKVLDHQLEGAFVASSPEHAKLECHAAFDEELVVITPLEVRSLNDLDLPKFIAFPQGCSYRATLEKWARANGVIPRIIMEMGTLEGILGFVSCGMGITLFPEAVIRKLRWQDRVRVHSIPKEFSQSQTVFIRRKDAVMTRAMECFIQALTPRR